MLRTSGVLALLASAALAVFLWLGVRSGRCPGRVVPSPKPGLSVCMDPRRASGNAWLLGPDNLVVFDGLDGALSPGTEVEIRHCYWVIQRPFFLALSAFSIRAGERTLVYERSVPAFFGILTLIAAAPLLVWSVAFLVAVAIPGRAGTRWRGRSDPARSCD